MGKKSNLGRSLIRDRFGGAKHKHAGDSSMIHTCELEDGYEWGRLNLRSVTEQSNLEDFLATAELAGTEFQAEKLNITFVTPTLRRGLLTLEEKKEVEEVQEKHRHFLQIPRRPQWTEATTTEELQAKERVAFLEWRRQLATLEEVEGIVLTPFEKNLEFWCQLWRVVERSDVVVQIVDARNPLLFRCEDLEKYVKEVSQHKMNLLLINKADFLTKRQRQIWAEYFTSIGLRAVFFSALQGTIVDPESDDREDDREENEMLHSPNIDSDENDSDQDYVTASEEECDSVNSCAATDFNQDSVAASKGQVDSGDSCAAADFGQDSVTASKEEVDDDKFYAASNVLEESNDILLYEEASTEQTSHSQQRILENSVKKNTLQHNIPVTGASLDTNFRGSVDKERADSACDAEQGGSVNEKTMDSVCDGEQAEKSYSSCHDTSNVTNDEKLLTRDELISLLKSVHEGKKEHDSYTTIGLVGYPNVGKSSTINCLLTYKKVPVSVTPGRTKHFQTLFVDEGLCLCDCPGLVMPSFVSTKAEMIISGILPIDQMRDHVPPISALTAQIPRHIFEDTYGIILPKPSETEDPNRSPTAEELLNAYGYNRGFMTPRGIPDNSRTARYVLKHYVCGKLLYCHAPPGFKQEHYHLFPPRRRQKTAATLIPSQVQKPVKMSAEALDKAFFKQMTVSAHVQGRRPVIGYKFQTKNEENISTETLGSNKELQQKPWKKHHNYKRREKLRRKYKYLDQ